MCCQHVGRSIVVLEASTHDILIFAPAVLACAGPIPRELGALSKLTTLRLSKNRLSGKANSYRIGKVDEKWCYAWFSLKPAVKKKRLNSSRGGRWFLVFTTQATQGKSASGVSLSSMEVMSSTLDSDRYEQELEKSVELVCVCVLSGQCPISYCLRNFFLGEISTLFSYRKKHF